MTYRDTIAAIATPPGIGGIGVIRVSGPEAEGIARRLFCPRKPISTFDSHRLYHGDILDLETGAILDNAVIALLKAPHSYTGEDTLEISCHGGPFILRSVLSAILKTGARLAEAGEFTKRAFLNDRLDLPQAEAVLDLIGARTREGLAAAMNRLKGGLTEPIELIRNRIIDLLAGIEASIDFGAEEGIVETSDCGALPFVPIIEEIRALAATYHRGRIYREGIGVVIAGRPNVGKSSLLNCLLGAKRAIVTPIPGTTRDFIEEALDLGGIPVRMTDTAGIRPPEDAIEKEGIDLLWERIATTDAVLILLDGSAPLTSGDRELIEKTISKPLIPVINKSDLSMVLDEGELKSLLPPDGPPPVRISAKYGEGIDHLKEVIHDLILQTPAEEASGIMIASLRHKLALEKAAEALIRGKDGLQEGIPPELAAIEVREALHALGEITGQTTPEEVIERIFANFCVGK